MHASSKMSRALSVLVVAGIAACGSQSETREVAGSDTLSTWMATLFDSVSAIHRDHPDTGLLRRLHPPRDTLLYVEGPLVERLTGDSLFRRVMALHVPVVSMRQQFTRRSVYVLDGNNALLTATERVDWVDGTGAHTYEGLLSIAVSRRDGRWVIRAYRGT